MENRKLAVLIDADNTPALIVNGLFEEIAKLGEASIRRIYGDFTGTQLRRWQDVLLSHAINPTQQFAYTKGKNASDITLVIEAMDILHAGLVDGFCLVSSDSDFTRLASRIREQGLVVYGFGAEKTPDAFVKACTRFIYIENLIAAETPAEAQPEPAKPGRRRKAEAAPAATLPAIAVEPSSALMPVLRQPADEPLLDAVPVPPRQSPSAAVPLILKAMKQMEDDDGWYDLGALGSVLVKLYPDFDARSYGSARLSSLLIRTGAFRDRKREGGGVDIARKPQK